MTKQFNVCLLYCINLFSVAVCFRDILTPSPFPDNGSCMQYNGTLCAEFLRGYFIYVRSYEKLENIETKLTTAYSKISEFKELSRRCRPFVLPLLCHYQFPNCDQSSSIPKPRQICYEECDTLRKEICEKEYQYIIAEGASLEQVLFPKCPSLPRKSTVKGKNCISFDVNRSKLVTPIPSKGECFMFSA